MLINRTPELATLTACVERVHHRGGALLIRGEPGIGKSALLEEAGSIAASRGFEVLAIKAVEFEAHLPYAGLHLLLRPLFGEMERLPSPHRAALRAAFGLSDDAAPDPFLIALATLNCCATTRRPRRSWSWWTMRTGSTRPRRTSSPSWPGGWIRIPSSSWPRSGTATTAC